jgi:hypothetical protein
VAQAGPRLVPPSSLADRDEARPPAERTGEEPWAARASESADREAREHAGKAGDAVVARAEEAQAELSRRREEHERREAGGEVPGLSEVGIEIAIGALRLARTILTAPLRLVLAFLRAREA